MKLAERFVVRPGSKARLARRDPADTAGIKGKQAARERVAINAERLAKLQYLLYAENRHALLIIFQAMDAGGKDGVIRHVMSAVNPQGCTVTSFKEPSAEEADHHYLWRIQKAVPARGDIGIFNRSHYEDVLVVRVHGLVPKSVWSKRYDEINRFERNLAENGVTLLKFFLHISKGEQKKRLLARIEDPDKNWKVRASDFAERKRWGDYADAYEEALSRCSTKWAPWYVIPSDKKWFRDLAVSEVLIGALERLKMSFPPPACDLSKLKLE